jgi:hydrogenase maturation factor
VDTGRAACNPEHGCITCSDEGVPMRVADALAGSGLATCIDDNGARTEVMTGIVGDVAAGDMLLVHAGTALLRLSARDGGSP